MNRILRISVKSYNWIRNSPYIRDNPPSVNFLIVLCTLAYFIVGADFHKEISLERNEIDYFVATLNESIISSFTGATAGLTFEPQFEIFFPLVIFHHSNNDISALPYDRAPPPVSSI